MPGGAHMLWNTEVERGWLRDCLGQMKDSREKTEVCFQKIRILSNSHLYQIRIEPPKEFKCGCKTPRCISFFCGCRRWGFRCNATCACSASSSCKNPLRNLGLLFGDDDDEDNRDTRYGSYDGEQIRPGGCFAEYIAKVAQSNPKNIDFEDLRCTLMGAGSASYFTLPEDPVFDSELADYLEEWKTTWLLGFRAPAEKKAHVQALFRYGLGDDGVTCDEPPERREVFYYGERRDEKRWFYSFCRKAWKQRDQVWHCRECGKCRGNNTWHCEKCKKCIRGLNMPCNGCEGVSNRPDDEEYEAEDDQMDDDEEDEEDDRDDDEENDEDEADD